jgi:polysaccharide export outer membrane protein
MSSARASASESAEDPEMSFSRQTSGLCAFAAILASLTAAGCKHGDFIWVKDVPVGMNTPEMTYKIGPGDVIGVRVWNQEANSVERARVREDGKISLPMLNDVEVAGSEPGELARRLEVKLKAFIMAPVVTVIVHERRPLRVSVVGKVVRPGVYDLELGAGVIHALAAAGGLTPFADEDGVFLLRSGYWADANPAPARIRFRYQDLRTGKAPAASFLLRAGDVVIAE